MKTLKQILILSCLIALLVLPYFVFASPPPTLQNAFTGEKSKLDPAASIAGYERVDESSVARIAGIVISSFLSLLGIIFIILIIYGGYLWMTARGNEQQVEKAKETLKTAIIGLVITLSSYAIWFFIWTEFVSG